MYIQKLRENAPVLPASASVESHGGSQSSGDSGSRGTSLRGSAASSRGSRSRGGGGGGRGSDDVASSVSALPLIGDEDDGDEAEPLL